MKPRAAVAVVLAVALAACAALGPKLAAPEIVGANVLPFDDREVARQILQEGGA